MAMTKVGPQHWREEPREADTQFKTVNPTPAPPSAKGTPDMSTFPPLPNLDPRDAHHQPPTVQHGEAMAISEFLKALKGFSGSLTEVQKAKVAQIEQRKAQHRNYFW